MAAASRRPASAVALPQPLLPRALDALMRLPDARWLDRLVRGRAWIALIALALMGLVFMQVTMLGMNAGIGQAVEEASRLERQNAALRQQVSQLASEERIQREAAEMGLVMPAAGDVRYLRSHGVEADARRAARVMRAPSAAARLTASAGAASAGAAGAASGASAPAQAAAPAASGTAAAGAGATGAGGGAAAPQPATAGTGAASAGAASGGGSTAAAGAGTAASAGAQTATGPASAQQQTASAAGAAAAPGSGQ